jgi:hypothetical protein
MIFWTVTPEWKGETAFVVAGGPSVREQNVAQLEGRNVIAVNSSYEIAPFAQFLVFGDKRWWIEHHPRLAEFQGRIVTPCKSAVPRQRLLCLRRADGRGLADDPSAVICGRTTTHAAINFAVHLGVKRIVLLGADMCRASDGRAHHHAEHPWPVREGCWAEQMEHLKHLVKPLRLRGIEVINTSQVSLIPTTWWPKAKLEDCL